MGKMIWRRLLLGILTLFLISLVVYAVHVPMLIGFTVARYHEPDTWNLARG